MTEEQVPIEPGLFTWPAERPQLIGSKCPLCHAVTFPKQCSCPNCTGEMAEELLPTQGRLWSWTIQGFLPKKPPYDGPETADTFVPYGVGYVELDGEVRVETRLTINDPAQLVIGMPMALVVVPFKTDSDGREVLTFAFEPDGARP